MANEVKKIILPNGNSYDIVDEESRKLYESVKGSMMYKGTLGSGGTIATLPTASESNKGFMYKVITAGTYQSIYCNIGDIVISDGSSWVNIPSGSGGGGSGTVTSVSAGTGLSISGDSTVNPTVNIASGYKLPSTSEWAGKVDVVSGKGLSTNDYTTTDKEKVTNIKGVDVVNGSTPSDIVKIWIDESTSGGQIFNNSTGTPLVASSVAEMTDTGRMYVLTSNQHLYAYTSGSWTDTEMIYGGAEVVQKRGTSTTAVMSQNATSKIWTDLGNDFALSFTQGKYIHKDTGAEANSYPYYMTNGYMHIVPGFNLCVNTMMNNDVSGLAYYDINKKFILGVNLYSSELTETILDVPENARYVRFSVYNPTYSQDILDSVYLKYKEVAKTAANNDLKINSDLTSIKTASPHAGIEVDAEVVRIEGKYIHANGALPTNIYYFYTQNYEVHAGDIIKVISRDPSSTNVSRISEWTSGGTYIRTIELGTTTETTVTYIPTKETEYLRFSGQIEAGMTIKHTSIRIPELFKTIVNSEYDKRDIQYWSYNLWKVLCIGDSLTSGAYYKSPYTGTSIDQNYPRILGRMLSAEVTNGGVSGDTSSDWYKNEISKYTLGNYDTFIIWLGTNQGLTDTLDTDVDPYDDYRDFADTHTGNYCKIICKIKEDKSDALILLVNCFASSGTLSTTNIVIEKISTKYGLPLLDNSKLNSTDYPELHAGINNPHFGKAGNIYLARRFIDKFASYFYEDPLRGEYGVTNRTN